MNPILHTVGQITFPLFFLPVYVIYSGPA